MRQCPKCNAQYSDDQAICPIDAVALVGKDASGKKEPDDPLINRTIADKYRIERLIGKGGMGAVYEGRHLLLDRTVAVKVLHQNMNADERAASRFIREAKASAKIEHPNAVTIHDFGVLKEGSAYLVMEYIRGRSLRQLLMKHTTLSLADSVDVIVQVCSVVEAAHQQGIIHRDLKPENVMLKETPDGSIVVKVVDFGLAKLVTGDGKEGGANLTQTGEVLGTPHYMAPEYYEGEEVDNRADIYAIGVILYEMLSGDAPFNGTVQSIIGGHLFKDPAPLFKNNPSVNEQLNDVVLHALKKKRDERINSASDFARMLKSAMQTVTGNIKVAATGPTTPENLARQHAVTMAPVPGAELERSHPPTGTISEGGRTDALAEGERKSVGVKRHTQHVEYNTLAMTQNVGPNLKEMPVKAAAAAAAATGTKTDYSTSPQNIADIEGEPESFTEMIVAMKKELAIGSVVVTLLALALVAFVILRTESSQIKVQPLPDTSTQSNNSQ